LIIYRLSKAGYGSIKELMELDARIILQALNYEIFYNEYQAACEVIDE